MSTERSGLKSQLCPWLRHSTGEINHSVTQFLSLEGENDSSSAYFIRVNGNLASGALGRMPGTQKCWLTFLSLLGGGTTHLLGQNPHKHLSYEMSPVVPLAPPGWLSTAERKSLQWPWAGAVRLSPSTWTRLHWEVCRGRPCRQDTAQVQPLVTLRPRAHWCGILVKLSKKYKESERR